MIPLMTTLPVVVNRNDEGIPTTALTHRVGDKQRTAARIASPVMTRRAARMTTTTKKNQGADQSAKAPRSILMIPTTTAGAKAVARRGEEKALVAVPRSDWITPTRKRKEVGIRDPLLAVPLQHPRLWKNPFVKLAVY